jgi:formylglycine-generating enzyme required for sulfatase activity
MERMSWKRRFSPTPPPTEPNSAPGLQDDWDTQARDGFDWDDAEGASRDPGWDSTARNPDTWATNRRRTAAGALPPSGAASDRNSAVARALNRALDDWWRAGLLPPTTLLRDGLLALEAGNRFDESQRTLLLRTALARRKGMVTALRYQGDVERTAVVLCDALLDPVAPLPIANLNTLQAEDLHSRRWMPLLLRMLRDEATIADEPRRGHAHAALQALGRPTTPPAMIPSPEQWVDAQTLTLAADRSPTLWTALVLLLLAVATVGALLWVRRQPEGGISIPAGTYLVADAADPSRTQQVDLAGFVIDRTEVAVADYRACVDRGTCSAPARSSSATRPNYWLDPAFSQHPVVNVDWEAASRYCAALGKRLPTAAEWEVAASYAPATRRRYLYPWGDRFQAQVANGAAGIGDTQAVGTYHPVGSSPMGMVDAAGNVAEWTSTGAPTAEPGPGPGPGPGLDNTVKVAYIVKGGAYGDEADQLTTTALRTVPAVSAEPWLGFRCVRNQ